MITTFRNVALGLVLMVGGSNLLTRTFHSTFSTVDPEYLGAVLLFTGILGIFGWWAQKTFVCRVSLIVADVVLVLCLVSEIVAIVGDGGVQVWLPVLLASSIAHDFVLVDSPFVDTTVWKPEPYDSKST